MLAIGQKAPDFTLPSGDGATVSLGGLLGQGPVVVFFYPRDDSPGCTKEACAFRDSFDVFQSAGASVVGISSDSASSHASFAKKHGLPFALLSDEGGAVRKAYGVKKTLGLIEGRATFVIDKGGVVRHAFNSQLQFGKHVDEAVTTVKALAK